VAIARALRRCKAGSGCAVYPGPVAAVEAGGARAMTDQFDAIAAWEDAASRAKDASETASVMAAASGLFAVAFVIGGGIYWFGVALLFGYIAGANLVAAREWRELAERWERLL
jgi:hypothetical protein